MTRVYIVLAIYLLSPVLIVCAFQKWSLVRKVGTVLIAYAVGIIMALSGLVSFAPDTAEAAMFGKIQNWIMNIAVPLAIPLMLFNCDFKMWTKALPKTIYSLLGGILAMLIAVVSGFFVFRSQNIPQFPQVAAMMTGIYTGGTMNFNALGASLGVQGTTMAVVLAFEMVLTTPYILFIIAGGYKIFRKALPYADEASGTAADAEHSAKVADVEDYSGMFRKKNVIGILCGLGLSLLFLVAGAGLSLLITGGLNELVVILTITTLAIIASFSKKVRQLPKTFETGMVLILLFSVVVASLFDIQSVNMSSLMIGGFVLYIMVVALLLHLLFCRLTKVSGDLFTVSQVALLCSPPFVPPVVGAMKNKKVLISGIAIGLVGYAVGTYLGVMIACLLSAI
ncbi:MAG: DUF819 family protein [Paludibacteraceae bacterium]